MPEISGTRVLFLDDSGKPSFDHQSKAVVIGGFSVPSQHVPALSDAISGAKSTFFPERGSPVEWEIKSRIALKSSRRRRLRQTLFSNELILALGHWDCTVYSVSIRKDRMLHEMSLKITMPLQVRVLAEHFAVECQTRGETGMLVSDWSDHSLDSHTSRQFAKIAASGDLPLHPCIYFADSLGSPAIQVADFIAGARRKSLEGDRYAEAVAARLAAIRSLPHDLVLRTQTGRPYATQIELFE